MLDLRSIVTDVGGLAEETARRGAVRSKQIEIALEQANLDDETWAVEHVQRIEGAKTRWLTARPLSARSLASATTDPPIAVPAIYTAIAVDGSQIPLDRHEIASCYVLNVGSVAIHYGSGERPTLRSAATLHYRDEDLFLRSGQDGEDAGNSFITDRELGSRRFLAEMEALGSLVEACADRPNAVAFVDGTLILWAQEAESREDRSEALRQFLEVVERARRVRIPIVGYLSRPASREVIGSLRVSLCPEEHVECKRCPYVRDQTLPCSPIDRLCDADLFGKLLSTGMRSGMFLSDSQVLKSYKPPCNKIAFFYLNAGSEIARIEVPRWVADDPALLERCHAVALDQARKGRGYPVCLSEAHERAVVGSAERAAFFRLVERALVKTDVPAVRTAKAVAKRRPAV